MLTNKYDGGGVMIYVKEGIPFVYREEFNLNFEEIEAVWIEINDKGNENILIACIYRPPDSKIEYFDQITNMLEQAYNENKELILLGDFNVDYKFDIDLHKNPINKLENMFEITQLVKEKTRITQKSATCIDLILSSIPERHILTGVAHIALSDHSLVYTCVEYINKNSQHKTITFRNFKDFDMESFAKELHENKEMNDLDTTANENINSVWIKWKDSFLDICNRHAPYKTMRVKNRLSPWITPEIIQLMYQRDHAKKLSDKHKTKELLNAYKISRNDVTSKLRKSKIDYFANIEHKHRKEPSKLWDEMKKITGKNKSKNITNPNIDCEAFNEYFTNIGKKISNSFDEPKTNWKNPECRYLFSFNKIETDEVKKALLNLSDSSNIDLLDFDSKLLRMASPYISDSLCKIYNMSLMNGEIPLDWKIARTTPVYKGKGNKDTLSNYRPISVVCHVSKILERIIQIQLTDYLNKYNLINIDQYAFRKDHSTITCLHRVIEDWIDSMNEHEMIGTCFLDISKCFDTVDHTLLLQKLNNYGIKNDEIKWFKNYLSQRKQVVKYGNNISGKKDIDIGIPQGSGLGPVLFLIFINDISQSVTNASCSIYADDVVIYVSGTTIGEINDKLQNTINNVHDWYSQNKLKINTDKTKSMLIKNNHVIPTQNLNIRLGNQCLENVQHIRYLGLEIDENLTWEHHIKGVTKSISAKLNLLSKLAYTLSESMLIKLYLTTIQPCIDYGISVWGNTNNKNKTVIHRLQKRAARIVTNNFDYNAIHGEDIIKQLSWKLFDKRRDYAIACLMFKCFHGTAPSRLCNEIEMVFDRHGYSTRNSDSLNIVPPKVNVKIMKTSLKYAGAHVWNELPRELKESNNVLNFKIKL